MSFVTSRLVTFLLVFAAICSLETVNRADDRRPLDHESYDRWNAIGGSNLSPDGRWFLYTLQPGKGDATLCIRDTTNTTEHKILRGRGGRFTWDSQFVACMIDPDPAVLKKARADKVPDAAQPKSELAIIDLTSGQIRTVPRVRSFTFPEKAGGWIAYQLQADPETKIMNTGPTGISQMLIPGPSGLVMPLVFKKSEPAAKPDTKKEVAGPKKSTKKKTPGTVLVVENLASGRQWRFPWVTEIQWTETGSYLAWAASGPQPEQDGVWIWQPGITAEPIAASQGLGNYRGLAVDEAGTMVAWTTDRDDYESKQPAWALWLTKLSAEQPAEAVVTKATAGIPEGSVVQEGSPLSFSKKGRRLFFNTTIPNSEADSAVGEAGEVAAKPADPENPVAKLDLWHWSEPILQTMQQVQVGRLRQRNFQAVYHLESKTVVSLANEEAPNCTVADEGDGDIGLQVTSEPYRLLSWESPPFVDVWLVNVTNGKRERVIERSQVSVQISPRGSYIVWWDGAQRHWFGMSTRGKQVVKLTEKLGDTLAEEDHDTPMLPGSYGSAGWTEGDRHFLVYDRYDLWQIDPAGKADPECLTLAQGREKKTRFRRVRLDREETFVDTKQTQYFSAFDDTTKASGYWSWKIGKPAELKPLVMLDESVGGLAKADQADAVVLTRQDFQRFPDYWKSTLNFSEFHRLTRANPQQQEYRWGSAELVHWNSTSGTPLEGVLYKPEGFNSKQKYPMIVYYYERNGDTLHRYVPPAAGRSTINFSFYVSRGYLVFIPDIVYETAMPGPSAMACIMPGVDHLVAQGFVDEKRMGLQGHSWGGYQTAYLVTQTDRFAAAEAGAPVSNMTSAYGGIRWESGMSRQFQYERTQSRIGSTMWENREAYIQNSPIFFADRIRTPLLILHNDKDGAVPWYQGIELFMALRRLERPAWLVNYNEEPHGITKEENRRDFAIRMQQFYDHYLQDAPPAEWMVTGIPAVDKGKKLGLDLVAPTAEPKTSAEQK